MIGIKLCNGANASMNALVRNAFSISEFQVKFMDHIATFGVVQTAIKLQ